MLYCLMKVKENLVYDKYAGEIVGFTSHGTVNDQLVQLERKCQADSHPQLAKQVLVLMIRGIFFLPYAHFGTLGVTGYIL